MCKFGPPNGNLPSWELRWAGTGRKMKLESIDRCIHPCVSGMDRLPSDPLWIVVAEAPALPHTQQSFPHSTQATNTNTHETHTYRHTSTTKERKKERGEHHPHPVGLRRLGCLRSIGTVQHCIVLLLYSRLLVSVWVWYSWPCAHILALRENIRKLRLLHQYTCAGILDLDNIVRT